MIVFRVSEEEKLIEKSVLDVYNQEINFKSALEFYGYFGNHLLWTGPTFDYQKKTFVQVFDYDTESGELKELVEKRVKHEESNPHKMQRVGDEFYYTGNYGTLMRYWIEL